MTSKQQEDRPSDATIREILRLFEEPLSANANACPWYCEPGATVDCNALLEITADDDFIDAAAWRILGCEAAGRQRRRWLARLRRLSRASVLVGMRYKTVGRKRAVRIPGLWFALLLDPPGRRMLGQRRAGSPLDSLRHKLVAWRLRQRDT